MNAEGQFDFGGDAQQLLQAVDLFQGYAGLAKPILLLRGSQSQAIKRFHQHALNGAGKFKSEAYWKQLAEMLETHGMLVKSRRTFVQGGFPVAVAEVSAKGMAFLLVAERSLWLKPNSQMLKFMRRKNVAASALDPSGQLSGDIRIPVTKESRVERLSKALMACRTALATRFDAMPYMIATNLALQQMAQAQPLNVSDLKAANVDGMSDAKIRQFGADFIACILRDRNFLPSIDDATQNDTTMLSRLQTNPMADVRCTDAQLRLLPLLRHDDDGLNLQRMASQLNIKETTVIGYLALLIKSGHPIRRRHIERLTQMSAQTWDTISTSLPKDADLLLRTALRPLKEALPDFISYDQIKLVLAYVQVRCHLRQAGVAFDDPDAECSVSQPLPEEPPIEPVDDETEQFDINEMLEDLNIPIDQEAPADSPITVDWGSDFEDDVCAGSGATSVPNKDVTPEELFMSVHDDEDDMLSKMDEPSVVAPAPYAASSRPPLQRTPAKIMPNKRVMYESDSDDADADESNATRVAASASTPSRKLPEWMLERRQSPAKVAKVQSTGARKKTTFF